LASRVLVGVYRDRGGGHLLVVYHGGALKPFPSYAQELFRDFNGFAAYFAAHRFNAFLDRVLDDAAGEAPVATLDEPLPPVNPSPRLVVGFGRSYEAHAREMGGGQVAFFLKAPTSLAGHRDFIEVPPWVSKPDYEGEVVVVIGSRLRGAARGEAARAIVGYTAGNDVTARDVQTAGYPWSMAKSVPTFGPVGPLVALVDEGEQLDDVCLETVLNGERVQEGCLSELVKPLPELVADASRFFQMSPGDLVFTGTPPGVGHARQPPRYLRHGDRVEVVVKGVSPLVNTVVFLPGEG